MPAVAQLDKSLNTALAEGYGTITIRVVVLEKGMASSAAPSKTNDAPLDAEPDEVLPETDKGPVSTFLEEPEARQAMLRLPHQRPAAARLG